MKELKGTRQPSGELVGRVVIPSSTGGALVQPDWQQNDETAPDYVKNRPCVVGEDGALAWNVPPVSDATILDALKDIDALPVVTDGGKILTANQKILLW